MSKSHIIVLKAIRELKFNIGKKTLIDFLKGNTNSTIDKHDLFSLSTYGELYIKNIIFIENLIDFLIEENLIEENLIRGKYKIIKITSFGTKEIYEKKILLDLNKLNEKKIVNKLKKEDNFNFSKILDIRINTVINFLDNEKKIIKALSFFFDKFNLAQKKAIVCSKDKILTIAGAGSGKTTVIVKRIEFLIKFKNILEKDILAITFTRKAKEEMQKRLLKEKILDVKVETFNSFCEKILQKNSDLISSKKMRVATFRDKISVVKIALKEIELSFEFFINKYFTKKQREDKLKEDLFFIFVNDLFSILDFYKNLDKPIGFFFESLSEDSGKFFLAKNIYKLVLKINEILRRKVLRDYTDQITYAISFFKKFKDKIPKFKHILVDEFQDVNNVQNNLLKILNPENIFVVGDPRQAIFEWRGSDIKFILEFKNTNSNCEIINLTKNYRSLKQIVNFCNLLIKPMGFLDLDSSKEMEKNCIYIMEHKKSLDEKIFISSAIRNSKNKPNEIFVIARTNRVLQEFANIFEKQGIEFIIKSEQEFRNKSLNENQVILATIHSIKGMEAKEVYLVDANQNSFPNKTADNFILNAVKESNFQKKIDEELRLFYVGISRAKEKLVISYTGNLTKFVTEDMLKMVFSNKKKNKNLITFGFENKTKQFENNYLIINILKNWRNEKSKQIDLPLYMILSNKAIDEISRLMPQSKEELESISGIGKIKIIKYGNEILRLINS